MRAPGIYSLLFISVFFSSCSIFHFPHRAYVGPFQEPLLIREKGGKQLSAGICPFKYIYGSVGFSPASHFAIQAHAGGYFGLINTHAAFLYYDKINNLNWHVGPALGFQDNSIHRRVRDISDTYWKIYAYSCRFRSTGVATGFSTGEKNRLHFGVRVLYNVVDRYNYYYESSDRYKPDYIEHLSYRIPDFFSVHPTMALVLKSGSNPGAYFKVQLEGNIVQKTLKHVYEVKGQTWYGYPYDVTNTYLHPVSSMFSLTLAYVFYNNK